MACRAKIYDLSLWMLLASLVGSKILMLFTEPEYRANPRRLSRSISCVQAVFFTADFSVR